MASINSILDKIVEFCSRAFALQVITYFLALGVCTIVLFLVFVLVYGGLLAKRTNDLFAFFYYLTGFFMCLCLSHVVLEMGFNFEPPHHSKVQQSAISVIEKQVKASEVNLDILRETLGSPDNLKLKDLKDISGKAIREAEHLRDILVQQKEVMLSFQREAVAQEKRAQRAIQLSALTEPQLEAVRELITEDSAKNERRSFVLGLLASLPIGIFSSLLGASLMRAFTRESQNAATSKS